jgi:L-ascorbate metabolism protein UlaG (beta-lactamase superfamily)
MELTWLGTAGFIIKSKAGEIVTDPFLSRGAGEKSPFSIKSFENCQACLVGHGHFDHTFDIPDIVKGTDLKVYAPGLTSKVLKMRGVSDSRLIHASNDEILFKPFKVRGFLSSHVNFDLPLMVSTLKRCGVLGCMHLLPLAVGYPKGLIQTYYMEIEGKKILFMSSTSTSKKELEIYKALELDYFLAPLAGHSSIQDIVAKQTAFVNPKVVIPHHHDDFYPPLSQNVSVDLFRDKLSFLGFAGKVLEIPLFKSCQI